jgi:hypothetical protein
VETSLGALVRLVEAYLITDQINANMSDHGFSHRPFR